MKDIDIGRSLTVLETQSDVFAVEQQEVKTKHGYGPQIADTTCTMIRIWCTQAHAMARLHDLTCGYLTCVVKSC